MVEFFELISSYWNQSKKDWKRNRHRLFTLFAFVLVAYLVLEFGSYIFTERLNHSRTVDEIRTRFIERKINLAEEVLRKFFILKENTRILINSTNKQHFSMNACQKLQADLKIPQLESDLFISISNLRYFYGNEITNDILNFVKWFDINNDNCFIKVPNAEQQVDSKIFAIRQKIWTKMYPPEIIKEIR